MATIGQAALEASERLLRVAEQVEGDRRRWAEVGSLVLRALGLRRSGAEGAGFVLARASAEVSGLPSSSDRRALWRLVRVAEDAWPADSYASLDSDASGDSDVSADPDVPMDRVEFVGALLSYAGTLERSGRLVEAEAALSLARVAQPRDPALALHAGRVARKLGDVERARASYAEVRELDGPCGRFARLAEIGDALLSADPETGLGRSVRAALRAGDGEAAAVGLEERAGVRLAAGERSAAMRDLCAAAARYTDPVDRARALHRLADIATAVGDALMAREVLLLALEVGDAAQRAYARVRLYGLSRALGDELGQRRWRPTERSALTSLAPYRPARAERSAAPAFARWRDRFAEVLTHPAG